MHVHSYEVANYKAYRAPARVEVRPLTILVGRNHAGKSALLRALPLMAHSMRGVDRQVLDLEAGGLRHGSSFEEIVHGQHVHGHVELRLVAKENEESVDVSARIQNIHEPGKPETEAVTLFEIGVDSGERFKLERRSLERNDRTYRLKWQTGFRELEIDFQGLLPRPPAGRSQELAGSFDRMERLCEKMRALADAVHYLKAQRAVPPRYLELSDVPPRGVGVDGALAPHILAGDDGVLRATRSWFRESMRNVTIDITRYGPVFQVVVVNATGSFGQVAFENAGHGLSQLLPVVVQRLAAAHLGPGVDLIEQPESDLHPAAHGAVADLFVAGIGSGHRAAIVETHSEMFLLRVRRRIAEGRIAPADVAVYWVGEHPEGGAALQEVKITESGDVEGWPQEVFYEDFEEVMAIRRAGRKATAPRGT